MEQQRRRVIFVSLLHDDRETAPRRANSVAESISEVKNLAKPLTRSERNADVEQLVKEAVRLSGIAHKGEMSLAFLTNPTNRNQFSGWVKRMSDLRDKLRNPVPVCLRTVLTRIGPFRSWHENGQKKAEGQIVKDNRRAFPRKAARQRVKVRRRS